MRDIFFNVCGGVQTSPPQSEMNLMFSSFTDLFQLDTLVRCIKDIRRNLKELNHERANVL